MLCVPAAMCLVIWLTGCRTGDGGKHLELHVADVDSRHWEKGSPVYLYTDNLDTLSLRELDIIIRYTDSFGYDKLLLTVETLSPERKYWTDTLSITTPDARMHPEQYHEISETYRSKVRFDRMGNYRFAVRHIMPDSLLQGVAGLGIQIK